MPASILLICGGPDIAPGVRKIDTDQAEPAKGGETEFGGQQETVEIIR